MADETIRIVYDPTQAQQGASTANKAMEGVESTATKSMRTIKTESAAAAAGMTQSFQKSQSSIDRTIRSLEQRTSKIGKTVSQQLETERNMVVNRLTGPQDKLFTVYGHYDKLIASAKQAERAEAEALAGSKVKAARADYERWWKDALDQRDKSAAKPGGGLFGFNFSEAITGAAKAIVAFKAVQAVLGAPQAIAAAVIEYQKYEKGLRAVSVSAQHAADKMRALRDVAMLPGMSMKPAIEGVVRLQAAGIGFAESTRMLKAFGNALATVGATQDDLAGVIIALTQISATPFVQGDEIRQLQERLPQIRKLMQDAFGTSRTEEIKKLGISSADFLSQLTNAAEALPKATATATDVWAHFTDTVRAGAAEGGGAIVRDLAGALEWFTKKIRETQEAERQAHEERKRRYAEGLEAARFIDSKTSGEGREGAFFMSRAIKSRLAGTVQAPDALSMLGDANAISNRVKQAGFLQSLGIPGQEQIDLAMSKAKEALEGLKRARTEGKISADQLTLAQDAYNQKLYQFSPAAREAGEAAKRMAEEMRKPFEAAMAKQDELDLMMKPFGKPSLLTREAKQRQFDATLINQRPQSVSDLANSLVVSSKEIAEANKGTEEALNGIAKARVAGDTAREVGQQQTLLELARQQLAYEERKLLVLAGPEGEAAVLGRLIELRRKQADLDRQMTGDKKAHAIAIQRIEDESELRMLQIARDRWQKQFDAIKTGFEGLFDALVMRSGSAWDAMKRMALAVFLTPIKEAMANMVASMFSGSRGGYASAGGGGFRGILGGVGGMLGGGGGGYAGTPPFWGGAGASGGSGGGWGQAGGMAGMFGGWKSSLSNLGNLGYSPARYSMDASGSLTKIAGAKGVGNWQGGAMLAGGGMLVYDGLRRGGWKGVAETTAGGALIGAKFGGPIGAAIGAGVGFAAGMLRFLYKGASEKAIEKVKALYDVKIDKQFAGQLVEMAKSQYGGNLDIAIRSQQIRDMILTYKMMTAQGSSIYDDRPRGVNLTQGAGGLMQAGTYVGGSLYGYNSSLPGAAGLKIMAPNPQQTVYVTIQADGQSTSDLIEGKQVQFINRNPGAISGANNRAMATGRGRITATSQILDPLAVGA